MALANPTSALDSDQRSAHPDDTGNAHGGTPGAARWRGWAWFAAVGAAFLWLYWPTLGQLVISWQGDEYYSHGPLLIPIAALLIWANRAALKRAWAERGASDAMRAPGAWMLLFGLGVAFLGQVADVNFVRAFSIPIVLLGIARWVGGGRFESQLRFPLLLLAAGVPISRVVVQTFSVPLQKMAASGASMALGLFGLPVQNQGVNIFTPRYNFVVDVPCSGLKTAIALLTVGLIVAYLLPGISALRRVILALSSVAVALVANVIRIIIIILIGIYMGREAAEGFLHSFSNVVTFGLSLLMMMALGHLLRQDDDEWEDDEDEASDETRAAAPANAANVAATNGSSGNGALVDIAPVAASENAANASSAKAANVTAASANAVTAAPVAATASANAASANAASANAASGSSASERQSSALPSSKPSWRANSGPGWRVPAMVVAMLVGTQLLGARAFVPDQAGPPPTAIRDLNLPTTVEAWKGTAVTVNPAVFEMLRPDVAVQKRYVVGDAKSSSATLSSATAPAGWVDSIVIYSRDARGFHAPEICLTAGGWTINNKESRVVRVGDQKLDVTLVTGERRGGQTHLAYFFADTRSQATGWVAMLAKEAMGRVMQRSTGTIEVQFAFGASALTPTGDFSPALARLMMGVSNDIQAQLEPTPAKAAP